MKKIVDSLNYILNYKFTYFGDIGLSDILSFGEHDWDLCESLLFDITDFGLPDLDLWEPDFWLCVDPILECLESDLTGDGLLEFCLEDLSLISEPTDLASFSLSEFLSCVEFAVLELGVPLRLDLDDPDRLSDSDPKRKFFIITCFFKKNFTEQINIFIELILLNFYQNPN